MKPVTLIGVSFLVAVGGTWSKDKTLSTKQVVGAGFLALMIGLMGESQPRLAQQFSWLILATTLGAYGEDLFTAIGRVLDSDKTPVKNGSPSALNAGRVDTTTGRKPV